MRINLLFLSNIILEKLRSSYIGGLITNIYKIAQIMHIEPIKMENFVVVYRNSACLSTKVHSACSPLLFLLLSFIFLRCALYPSFPVASSIVTALTLNLIFVNILIINAYYQYIIVILPATPLE